MRDTFGDYAPLFMDEKRQMPEKLQSTFEILLHGINGSATSNIVLRAGVDPSLNTLGAITLSFIINNRDVISGSIGWFRTNSIVQRKITILYLGHPIGDLIGQNNTFNHPKRTAVLNIQPLAESIPRSRLVAAIRFGENRPTGLTIEGKAKEHVFAKIEHCRFFFFVSFFSYLKTPKNKFIFFNVYKIYLEFLFTTHFILSLNLLKLLLFLFFFILNVNYL